MMKFANVILLKQSPIGKKDIRKLYDWQKLR